MEHLQKFIKALRLRPRCVLDIGAHDGESIDRFRSIWPDVEIWSFEPNPSCWAKLAATVAKYPDVRSRVIPCALGAEKGTVPFFEFPKATASSSILQPARALTDSRSWAKTTRQKTVEVDCLDNLYECSTERSPLFVKIDVQGFESKVIDGGAFTLAHARACLIEVNHEELYVGCSTFREVHNQLRSLGFRYNGISREVKTGGKLSWADHFWSK